MSNDEDRFNSIVKSVSDDDRQKIISRVEEMDLPDARDNELIDDAPMNKKVSNVQMVKDESILESSAFKSLMRKNMSNFTVVEKIIFHLQTIFLRKNQAELFRNYYLRQLEQEVQASGNYVNFDTKVLTSRFAVELFELYKAISPLKAPLEQTWQNKRSLHTVITDLLDQGTSGIKRNLEDFVPIDQLLNIFIENNNSDEAVRRHILKSVKSYTDSLSSIRMKEIRSDLLPLFYLNKLANFPFLEVFKIFGVSPSQLTDVNQGMPSFKTTVPVSILLDYLIHLDTVLKWASHLNFSESVVRYFYKEFYVQESKRNGENVSSSDLSNQVADASRDFHSTLDRINRANSRLPLTKMLQVFTQNPVYKTPEIAARLDVRQFYGDTFKSIAISELDTVLVQMRIAYFKQMLGQIFQKMGYSTMEFYINSFNHQWETLGLPQFRHTKSLEVVYNFLHYWIPTKMHNIFGLMITNILVKVASLQIQMEEFKIAIDLVEDKLKKFDKSLSFEYEAGKKLLSYKDSLNSNSLKRAKDVTSFIVAQDVEALSLIENALYQLENFANFLKNKIIEGSNDSLKPIIASIYSGISRNQSLQEVLRQRSEDILIFVVTIREIIRYEKEGISIGELMVKESSSEA